MKVERQLRDIQLLEKNKQVKAEKKTTYSRLHPCAPLLHEDREMANVRSSIHTLEGSIQDQELVIEHRSIGRFWYAFTNDLSFLCALVCTRPLLPVA